MGASPTPPFTTHLGTLYYYNAELCRCRTIAWFLMKPYFQRGEIVSDRSEADRTLIMNWLNKYVCRPYEQLGRPGAICPFVEPALQADCLRLELVYLHEEITLNDITAIVRQGAKKFQDMVWPKNNRLLHSLVIALPNIPLAQLGLVDEAHACCKTELVNNGLMLGQFHQQCPDRAVRNNGFLVSISPLPLFAFRWMAIHDILFLHHEREWFLAYFHRFAQHYASGGRVDPLFRRLFENAKERYGCY
jgi:hypothetical protein